MERFPTSSSLPVVMGDEWFNMEKLFCQFLRPITVQELRDLHFLNQV